MGMSCYGPLLNCRQQLSMTGIDELMASVLFVEELPMQQDRQCTNFH